MGFKNLDRAGSGGSGALHRASFLSCTSFQVLVVLMTCILPRESNSDPVLRGCSSLGGVGGDPDSASRERSKNGAQMTL